jgi:hypothetical protein
MDLVGLRSIAAGTRALATLLNITKGMWRGRGFEIWAAGEHGCCRARAGAVRQLGCRGSRANADLRVTSPRCTLTTSNIIPSDFTYVHVYKRRSQNTLKTYSHLLESTTVLPRRFICTCNPETTCTHGQAEDAFNDISRLPHWLVRAG